MGHPSTNAQHAIGCAYGAFKETIGAGDSDSVGANLVVVEAKGMNGIT